MLRLNNLCTLCQRGVLGGEKYITFECPALQELLDGSQL